QPGVWSLYRITWEGESTCLLSMEGKHYFSEHPEGFYGNRFYVFGDYLYYCAASEQGEGIYRLSLAEAKKNADTTQSQLVCLYYEDKSREISYTESVITGPEGDMIALPTQFDKLYLYEQTNADRKINAFLDKVYRECEEELTEDNEVFCQDFETEWERLWENWFSEKNPDIEEQERKKFIAEQSNEEISISITYLSEAYLVVDVSGYSYWFPGAHGIYWNDFYVFDRRTGERITILDFVDNTEEEVEEIVSNYLEMCGFSSGAEGIAQEIERFYLTAEGIGIHYDVYELADYASGAQYITIPYAEFRIKEE
ncbi:MAG: RsiV family protein, partial [Lachnospiraceae bacterium]|nr:RsiV family protein [Lachnospiraceae bacterium]